MKIDAVLKPMAGYVAKRFNGTIVHAFIHMPNGDVIPIIEAPTKENVRGRVVVGAMTPALAAAARAHYVLENGKLELYATYHQFYHEDALCQIYRNY